MQKQFIWNSFLNILFPPYCVNCFSHQLKADLFSFVCARCFLSIRQKKNPLTKLKPYDRLLSYGSYADPALQKVIFQFKYRFVKELANPLSELLITTLNEGGIETFLQDPLPIVTFIPLAPLRERWRGFNQSQLLASRVASYFNIPLLPLLGRAWLAPAQAKIENEAVREKIIKGAFRLSAQKSFPPQKVLVVDDVLTSGATLKEAGRVLKRWGVKELWGLTVAG